MAISQFLKKSSNRIAVYITILQYLLLLVLIITAIVPIPDDPPIYHFPFMVYIEYIFAIEIILYPIKGVLLRKNEGKFKQKSDSWRLRKNLILKVDWTGKIGILRNIVRWLSVIFLFGTAGAYVFLGIISGYLMFSPGNMFFLPGMFSLLALWTSMSVKKENISISLYLLIIGAVLLGLFIWALYIAQDQFLVPFATSYQIAALVLIGIRLLYHWIFEKRKE